MGLSCSFPVLLFSGTSIHHSFASNRQAGFADFLKTVYRPEHEANAGGFPWL
jgi:hypothetical protein